MHSLLAITNIPPTRSHSSSLNMTKITLTSITIAGAKLFLQVFRSAQSRGPPSPPTTCKTCGQAITFPTRQAYPMTERERSDVIERFRHIAETDSRVLASFLGGSLAAGTADTYSDIDIYFVVDPSEYDSFHSDVASLLNTFGPLVYFDQHNDFGFDLALSMFKNTVIGELGLGTTRNLKNMHRGPFKVLVDKTGVMDNVEFPLPPPLTGK